MAKKSTTSKYLTEATKLGTSKYAPAEAQIAANEATNRSAYDTGSSQRLSSVNAELGSIQAAGATTNKLLTGLGTETGTLYQQALAKSQSDYQTRTAQTNQSNSNLMSSLQSEMAARGLTQTTSAQMRLGSNAAFSNDIMSAIQGMNEGALTRQGLNAQGNLKEMQGMSSMLGTTASSGARGEAQKTFDNLYNAFLEKQMEFQGQKTVTKKEKADYVYQTYLTLKEQAAQKAAAKAQAAQQAAIASGNLNYKYDALKTNTQYKYDKLAADTAKNDIANSLKERGFTHKQSMDIANLTLKKSGNDLAWQKFDWSKISGGKSGGMSDADVANIIAGLK